MGYKEMETDIVLYDKNSNKLDTFRIIAQFIIEQFLYSNNDKSVEDLQLRLSQTDSGFDLDLETYNNETLLTKKLKL